jgi:DNA-binding response OmpR family regulator
MILIIEDDPDIAEVLRYGLENQNRRTRVALNGEEGLSASLDKHNPPSLILLDLLVSSFTRRKDRLPRCFLRYTQGAVARISPSWHKTTRLSIIFPGREDFFR